MSENVIFDFNALLNELRGRAREEGVTSREAYEDLVSELLNEKLTYGELHDDNNLMTMKEQLLETWEEFNRGR